jgi:23S rRNA pseudouridine1911/1915/1917 synthase
VLVLFKTFFKVKLKIDILHEHTDFIAVNKPSGMLSIPDRFNKEKANVQSLLKLQYSNVFTVHRLDRETSGIMIFALNAESHKYFSDLFLNHTITKIYHAVVEGVPFPEVGIIERNIAKDPATGGKMKIHIDGKYAKTGYKVLASYKKFSLVEAQIFTGRTHQVRVHLKHIGHPLVADGLYGLRESLFIKDIKPNYRPGKFEVDPIPIITRTALHSRRVEFDYKGITLKIEAPYPKDMKACLNQMQKLLTH